MLRWLPRGCSGSPESKTQFIQLSNCLLARFACPCRLKFFSIAAGQGSNELKADSEKKNAFFLTSLHVRSYKCFVTLIDVLFLSVNSHVLVYQVFLNTHSHNTYMTEHAFTSSFSFFKFVFLFRVLVRCVCQPFFFYHKTLQYLMAGKAKNKANCLNSFFG